MFQRRVYITSKSYVEVSSRVFDGQDQLLLSIFGPKNENESILTSVVLDDKNTESISKVLQEALVREKSWPPKSEGGKE